MHRLNFSILEFWACNNHLVDLVAHETFASVGVGDDASLAQRNSDGLQPISDGPQASDGHIQRRLQWSVISTRKAEPTYL